MTETKWMTPEPDSDLFREAQRLRAHARGLEDDNTDLRQRLAYAWMEVERLRAQVFAARSVLQTGEPVEWRSANVVAVTPAELDAVLGRLGDVRPLPLA